MDEPTRSGAPQLEKLEATVRRVVAELQALRAQHDAACAEAEKMRAALRERRETLKRLEGELLALQTEREQVRGRIEQLVDQIDSLTGVEK